MAQASPDRCFYGSLKEYVDADGITHFFSRIELNNGYICASASDRKELSRNLDDICKMVLDNGLHKFSGMLSKTSAGEFYLN